ncbi:FimD/PapC N-terminal domain-containing protein, partial [Salmonella enterica]
MLRMTPIASLVLLTLFTWQTQAIATETFDTHFMVGGMRDQKITNFHLDENKPIPGQYELDIYVNNQWRGKYDIIVADDPGSTCISTELLKNIGVISDGLQPQGATDCIALKDVVRSGGYTFNIGVFRLDLSVPQAYVNEVEAGYVLPENWDRGINAFYTSYYASQYYSDYKNSGSSESTYVRFNSGFNLLGWQAHADTTFNKTDGSSGEWKSNTLY